MANGDDETSSPDEEYEFVCNDDACEICQALANTTSPAPLASPHANCRCSVLLRNRKGCEYTYEIVSAGDTQHYGPNGQCFLWTVQIEVTCHDGTTIGGSLQIDMGCDTDNLDIDGLVEKAWDLAFDAALDMADGCPGCEFLCC
jgi:hypothetical protein